MIGPVPDTDGTPLTAVCTVMTSDSENPGNAVVVFLGMHRAGTSLLAHVGQRLGVELGDNLKGPRADNPDGFFEHTEIVDRIISINRKLHRAPMRPSGLLPYPHAWWREDAFGEDIEALREIVRHEVAHSSLWGFKDPHSIRMLPMWTDLLNGLGLRPLFVISLRRPEEVVESVVARDPVTPLHAETLWLNHYAEGIRGSAGFPRTIVSYEDWFGDPLPQARALARFLGLPEPDDDGDTAAGVRACVKPGLHHHEETARPAQCPDTAPLYDALLRYRSGADDGTELHARVARYEERLEAAPAWREAIESVTASEADLKNRNADLKKRITGVKNRNERLENEIEDKDRQLAEIKERLTDQADQLSERDRRIRHLNAQLTAATAEGASGRPNGASGDPWRLSFPALSELPQTSAAGDTLRICIATQDIVGPIRNGGVGTAYYYAARLLARAGHRVTILYALGTHCENGSIDDWIDWYAELGIALVPMPTPEVRPPQGILGRNVSRAYDVYSYLREHEFDVVHVSEWRGLGYYALLAKHLGLAFRNTRFVVKTSSPTIWNKVGNAQPVDEIGHFITSYLERKSVELADLVVSGSQYMLRWMADEGYALPEGRCFVQPNIMPAPEDRPAPTPGTRHPVREIVFFGRLEPRKGLHQFCDALTQLGRQLDASDGDRLPSIVFLGKPTRQFDAEALIAEKAKAWPFAYRIVSDLNQPEALAFLQASGRLAVLCPTRDNSPFGVYECLAHRLPFVASNIGGIPELVAESDRSAALFELHPATLADKLQEVLDHGAMVPAATFDFHGNDSAWLNFHSWLAHPQGAANPLPAPVDADATATAPDGEPPLVTVCIAHFNRPKALRQAIRSVEAQDYGRMEVVLVDDGSTRDDALKALAAIEREFAPRGWQVVRQRNSYLGAARNTAVRHARGRYLYFLDDDNVLKPQAISTLVRLAERHRADVLTSFSDVFTGEGPPTAEQTPEARVALLGDDLAVGLLYNGFGDANALVRRAAVDALGGFTEDYKVGKDDQEFFARAILEGHRLFHVPEALYWKRESPVRLRNLHYSWGSGDFRVIRPYLAAAPDGLRRLILMAHGGMRRSERLAAGLRQRDRELSRLKARRREEADHARSLLNSRSWRAAQRLRAAAARVRGRPADDPVRHLRADRDAPEILRRIYNSIWWDLTAPLRLVRRITRT